MSDLATLHQANGATLATDGIPLHYGDLRREYEVALSNGVLLDRSHEGRISLVGRDALALINRMSTNKTDTLKNGEGCATVFLTPTARIIEKVDVFKHADDVLMLTHPPRLERMMQYLKSNIFYNDQVTLHNLTETSAAFALHGTSADAVIEAIQSGLSALPLYGSQETTLANCPVTVVRRVPLVGSHFYIVCDKDDATNVYAALQQLAQAHGIIPAGSLTYNTLRIRAGVPSLPELTEDNIPLELGLWDDVSFHKGCYTGQEIIARMDSRERLAKVLVRLHMTNFVQAPTPITSDGKAIGTLTSSVQAPDGKIHAMGLVKTSVGEGTEIQVNGNAASVGEILGTQPAWVS